MTINLLHQEAHVWFSIPESVQDDKILQGLRDILSREELDRYRRFHFPEDRHQYLVSHALVRESLSKYVDFPAQDWLFSRGEYGRPEIANPGIPPLRFNLTHTDGLVGCVVTMDDDCGIDTEKITDRHETLKIAERMFTEAEYRELLQLKDRQHLEYFFTRWTLREAYVKARGTGLFLSSHKPGFEIAADNSIAVSFDSGIDNKKERWNFRLLPLSKLHVTAVALNGTRAADKDIVIRRHDFVATTDRRHAR